MIGRCRHCHASFSSKRTNQKFCDDKCYARAYQARRRARMKKESLVPTQPRARSKEEEWYMDLLLPLGYKMNEVRVPYFVGVFKKHYTLDFALTEEKINIEIDGIKHQSSPNQKKDWDRDQYLKSLGWKVIRIRSWSPRRLCWPFVGSSSGKALTGPGALGQRPSK